ncbi:gamma-glutamyl-gamma-aminobutyrate hydrolase family protein [Fructilactobacillus carniphilus]|uniref:Gamma-glutamyl-gamma-aminobutyrate hydrolase family protein n=1 Tax=Fructilactobacillus carniphilus TaxID=2940297 RepID=A0ABY5BZV4_9LACO|nr:gamma-glutamyl-gamma-aminobutyrate hydrolase family protein [Fructilactobacillus carniphilus]USS91334.1 gamma-glutamyl-gamma-aminobutyrate hydrolase family protein [Fructilactobacillus carniphilus]
MRIGITANVNLGEPNLYCQPLANCLPKTFIDVVTKHQHIPVILPVVKPEMAPELVKMVDAVIIPGGQDIDPEFFNESPQEETTDSYELHDEFEFAVAKAALNQHKPVLGICRGYQLLNVAFGGSLYQDLPTEFPGHPRIHEQRGKLAKAEVHEVEVEPGTQLSRALGTQTGVNSRHHQGLNRIAPNLHVVAEAADGVPEAVEDDSGLLLGVQWHPEDLWQTDVSQERLFTTFFRRADL